MGRASVTPRRRAQDGGRIAEAIYEALASLGEDGTGKNGVVGYFKWLERKHPRVMARLVGKALRTRPNPEEKITRPRWTQEELAKLSKEEIKELHRKEILEPIFGPDFTEESRWDFKQL
jgi:hypothetical protein